MEPSYFHSEKEFPNDHGDLPKCMIAGGQIIQAKIGTVGAVAIDKKGNISAATSTGGMTNKMPGRVGDTPIIGSGTLGPKSSLWSFFNRSLWRVFYKI